MSGADASGLPEQVDGVEIVYRFNVKPVVPL